jgi:hypothetical protein
VLDVQAKIARQIYGGQMTIPELLEAVHRGVWIHSSGKETLIQEMSNDWLWRVITMMNIRRSANTPSARVQETILAVFKVEADRRGLRHPVFYPPDERCHCGKKGLYRVDNRFFCSDHRHEATTIKQKSSQRIDSTRGRDVEASTKDWDNQSRHTASLKTTRRYKK